MTDFKRSGGSKKRKKERNAKKRVDRAARDDLTRVRKGHQMPAGVRGGGGGGFPLRGLGGVVTPFSGGRR